MNLPGVIRYSHEVNEVLVLVVDFSRADEAALVKLAGVLASSEYLKNVSNIVIRHADEEAMGKQWDIKEALAKWGLQERERADNAERKVAELEKKLKEMEGA